MASLSRRFVLTMFKAHSLSMTSSRAAPDDTAAMMAAMDAEMIFHCGISDRCDGHARQATLVEGLSVDLTDLDPNIDLGLRTPGADHGRRTRGRRAVGLLAQEAANLRERRPHPRAEPERLVSGLAAGSGK